MAKKLWFLLVIAIGIIGISFSAPPVCPRDVDISGEVGSCWDICDRIFDDELKDSFSYYYALGYLPTSSIQGTCICYFVEEEDGVITRTFSCEYLVSKAETSDFAYELPFDFQGQNIPETLIKIFSFDKNAQVPAVIGTSGMDILVKAMYTIYTVAIYAISILLTFLFISMVGLYNLTSKFYSNLFSVVEHGKRSFSIPSMTDTLRVSIPAILAIAFFAMPVRTSSPIFTSTETGISDKVYTTNICAEYERTKQAVSQQQIQLPSQGQTQGDNFLWDIIGDIGRTVFGDNLWQRIVQIISSIFEEQKQEFENTKNQVIAELDDVQEDCEKRIQLAESENRIFKPEEDPSKIPLPLAVVMAKQAINFGVSIANEVSKYTNTAIETYLIDKLSQNIVALEKGFRIQKARYEQTIEELKALLQTSVSNLQCPIKSCENLYSSDENTIAKYLANYPDCKPVITYVRSVCQKIEELNKQIGELQRRYEERRQVYVKELQDEIREIERSGGFLSPAMMPLLYTFSLFADMKDLNEKKYTVSLTKENYESSSFFSEAFQSVYSFGYGAVSGTKKAVMDVVEPVSRFTSSMAKNTAPVLDKGALFLLGQLIAITSYPPGKWVEEALESVSDAILKAIDKITTKLAVIFSGPTVLGLGAVSVLGSMGAKIMVKILAYNITILFFKLIPFVVVSFAVLTRFLVYLFDIVALMLSIPFYAVGAVSKNPSSALDFFKQIAKVVIYPVILVIVPVIAFLFFEVAFGVYFWLLITIVANVIPDSWTAGFYFGLLTIVSYTIGTAIASYYGWHAGYVLPEKAMEYMMSLIGGASSTIAQRFEGVKDYLSQVLKVRL